MTGRKRKRETGSGNGGQTIQASRKDPGRRQDEMLGAVSITRYPALKAVEMAVPTAKLFVQNDVEAGQR